MASCGARPAVACDCLLCVTYMFGAKGLAAASLQSLVEQVLRMKVIVEWELHREIEVTPDQVAPVRI